MERRTDCESEVLQFATAGFRVIWLVQNWKKVLHKKLWSCLPAVHLSIVWVRIWMAFYTSGEHDEIKGRTNTKNWPNLVITSQRPKSRSENIQAFRHFSQVSQKDGVTNMHVLRQKVVSVVKLWRSKQHQLPTSHLLELNLAQ